MFPNKAQKNKVSIIIPHYNSPKIVISCIRSIIKYTKNINFEIILIDNGSSSKIIEILEESLTKTPNLKIIFLNQNVGFGQANNVGVETSTGNYLLFLNSDTLFYENTIEKLLQEYSNISKSYRVGFIQPILYLDAFRHKIQKTSSKVPSLFNIMQENFQLLQLLQPQKFAQFKYLEWDRKSSKVVEAICGAAMFCQRTTFIKIGCFDPRFNLYFEEYDLCGRAIKLGYFNYYTAHTGITHLHQATPRPRIIKKLIYLQSLFKYILKINFK